MAFFHVGLVVKNLEAAMKEMSDALGITWREPHDSTYGEWNIKVVYSIEGPPFVELVQGEDGGPWDTARGSHIDHIGVWSEDMAQESERMVAAGLPIHFDPATVGRGGTFCYHKALASGATIELVSTSARSRLDPSYKPS